MKAGKPHRVPLFAAAALPLPRRMHVEQLGAVILVFPSAKADAALFEMSLAAVVRRINIIAKCEASMWCAIATGTPITVHGIHSMFRVWAGE